jgi:hypothetical protein
MEETATNKRTKSVRRLSRKAWLILLAGVAATATLEILDDPPEQTVNPTDMAEQFVCQHYHDFLNRQHDMVKAFVSSTEYRGHFGQP